MQACIQTCKHAAQPASSAHASCVACACSVEGATTVSSSTPIRPAEDGAVLSQTPIERFGRAVGALFDWAFSRRNNKRPGQQGLGGQGTLFALSREVRKELLRNGTSSSSILLVVVL